VKPRPARSGGKAVDAARSPRDTVERYRSGGPWEESFGYSRAVSAGPLVFVAGCTSVVEGSISHEGDPYQQALTAMRTAERALAEAGVTLADVVQTRMYIVHTHDAEEVGRAHSEVFGAAPPAATMVVVNGLLDMRMLVEVEVVAYRRMIT
jgi:enamine deaminase RidA (YjgF/YER057c/UK114 family)